VTVTDPAGLAVPVGVTVTMYVRAACACGWGVVELPITPQPISKPDRVIANTTGNTAIRRFRRKVKGTPSRAAQKINVPPFHGIAGIWFAAFALAVMVTVEVPMPPEVSVTEVAVAVTSAGVPSVELTAVTKETVPA